MTDELASPASPSFRLAYVPGVTPTKWIRVWEERLPDVPLALVAVAPAESEQTLREGTADAGLVRLPVDRGELSAIPLYTEATVVVFPKDHWLAAADEAALADLAEELVLHPLDDTLPWDGALPGQPALERPASTGDAIELVAAGVGVVIVPQSLARLHHRRDLTYRPLGDAPQSQIALAWPEARTTDLVEEFIGIVRGRTVNSSRGRAAGTGTTAEPAQKPAAGGRGASGGRAGAAKGGGTGKGAAARGGASKGGGTAKGGGAARSGGAAKSGGGRPRGGSSGGAGGSGRPGAKGGKPRRRS